MRVIGREVAVFRMAAEGHVAARNGVEAALEAGVRPGKAMHGREVVADHAEVEADRGRVEVGLDHVAAVVHGKVEVDPGPGVVAAHAEVEAGLGEVVRQDREVAHVEVDQQGHEVVRGGQGADPAGLVVALGEVVVGRGAVEVDREVGVEAVADRVEAVVDRVEVEADRVEAVVGLEEVAADREEVEVVRALDHDLDRNPVQDPHLGPDPVVFLDRDREADQGLVHDHGLHIVNPDPVQEVVQVADHHRPEVQKRSGRCSAIQRMKMVPSRKNVLKLRIPITRKKKKESEVKLLIYKKEDKNKPKMNSPMTKVHSETITKQTISYLISTRCCSRNEKRNHVDENVEILI